MSVNDQEDFLYWNRPQPLILLLEGQVAGQQNTMHEDFETRSD